MSDKLYAPANVTTIKKVSLILLDRRMAGPQQCCNLSVCVTQNIVQNVL